MFEPFTIDDSATISDLSDTEENPDKVMVGRIHYKRKPEEVGYSKNKKQKRS